MKYAHSPVNDKNKVILKLQQALEDIVNPIARFKRQMKPGEKLDGVMCTKLSENPDYLKQIAREALEESLGRRI